MDAEYVRHWLLLGVSLTEDEAEAVHRALIGCPVKTPALRHAIVEVEATLARFAPREQELREHDAAYGQRVKAARERRRNADQ